MYCQRIISHLLFISALPITVQAQSSLFSVNSNADAYQCLNPNPPKCISLSQDPSQCPGCTSWGTVFLQLKSPEIEMNREAYLYATGAPRANVMVKDAANQMYSVPYPVTETGDPVKISNLYANPEEYDWIEIKGGEALPGAVALWPNVGGVLVESDTLDGEDEGTPSKVLYPSDKNEGLLIIADPESLNALGAPKFVIPETAVQSQAAPQ